jgi:hypothetical protein
LELLVHQGKHLNQEGVVKVRASKNELKTYEFKISGKDLVGTLNNQMSKTNKYK